jgi:hypothetical protein
VALSLLQRKMKRLFDIALQGKLSGKEDLTDVWFELDDGLRMRGHRSVMSVGSEYFYLLFTIGMMEAHTGIVHVTNCNKHTFLAIVEFLYLGEISKERLRNADGGELWRLADAWGVENLREGLKSTISTASVCYAMEVAICHEDQELLTACIHAALTDRCLEQVGIADIKGVSSEAIRQLVRGYMCGGGSTMVAFFLMERWWEANCEYGTTSCNCKTQARALTCHASADEGTVLQDTVTCDDSQRFLTGFSQVHR